MPAPLTASLKGYVFMKFILIALSLWAAAWSADAQSGDAGQKYYDMAYGFDYPAGFATAWRKAIEDGSKFTAAVWAFDVTPPLQAAKLNILCKPAFFGTSVEVGVSYLYEGGRAPGDSYSLNLSDSADSGRPAAYNMGDGFIRTDRLTGAEPGDVERTQAYQAAVARFERKLLSVDDKGELEVRFVSSKSNTPYVAARFKMAGIRSIQAEIAHFCLAD